MTGELNITYIVYLVLFEIEVVHVVLKIYISYVCKNTGHCVEDNRFNSNSDPSNTFVLIHCMFV